MNTAYLPWPSIDLRISEHLNDKSGYKMSKTDLVKYRVSTVIRRYKKRHGTVCGADIDTEYKVISVSGW